MYQRHAHSELLVRRKHRRADLVIADDVIRDDCYRVADLPRPILTCIDVGAHIGSFVVQLRRHRPEADIVAVEANPANIAALERNAGRGVRVFAAAVAYRQPVELLSTVWPGTSNTGGSFIVPAGHSAWQRLPNAAEYRPAGRVPTITLEAILARTHWRRIDLLKLDCEGSEFEILSRTRLLPQIGCIVGEWHDERRLRRLVQTRFPPQAWTLDVLRSGTPGLFRLSRPDWWNMQPGAHPA